MTLTATGGDVLVDRIRIQAEGTLNDAEDVTSVAIYRDTDGNESFSLEDELLGSPKKFVADDGLAFLYDLGGIVSPRQPEHWFVALELAGSAPPDGRISVKIEDVEAMESRGFFPSTPLQESGEFPLLSNPLGLGAATVPSGFRGWLGNYFDPAELDDSTISGPEADPDGDGMPNLAEYAFGFNPKQPESNPLETNRVEVNGEDFLQVSLPWNEEASDIQMIIESSEQLTDWQEANHQITERAPFNQHAERLWIQLEPSISEHNAQYYRFLIRVR